MGRISNDGTMQTAHFNKESHRPRYRHLYTCTYTPAPVQLYIMASHAPVHALLRIFTTCTLAHAHLSSNQHLVTTQPKLGKTSLEPNQNNHALAHLRIQSRSQIRHAMHFINSSCHAIRQFIMPCKCIQPTKYVHMYIGLEQTLSDCLRSGKSSLTHCPSL